MKVSDQLSFLVSSAVGVLYPEHCLACSRDLVRHEKHICSACAFDLPYITDSVADREKLNKLLVGRVPVEQVYSLFRYQKGNQVQTILHAIKYKAKPRVAYHFGKILGEQISAELPITGVVAVPLHLKKMAKRGYNQAAAISEGIATALNVPIIQCVKRNTNNDSQTRFSKYDRYDNVRSIFSLTHPDRIQNKHILLVDDVLTTGATIEACVAELLKAEQVKISIATLAARV